MKPFKLYLSIFLFHPLTALLFAPLNSILVGSFINISQTNFQVVPFVLLYLSLLCGYILEMLFSQKNPNDAQKPFAAWIGAGLAAVLTAAALFTQTNIIILFLLMLYYAFIIFYAYFPDIANTSYLFILQSLFKVFLFNLMAFQIQNSYLEGRLIVILLPYLFLFLAHAVFLARKEIRSTGPVPAIQPAFRDFIGEHGHHIYMVLLLAAFLVYIVRAFLLVQIIGLIIFLLCTVPLFLFVLFNNPRKSAANKSFFEVYTFAYLILYLVFLI